MQCACLLQRLASASTSLWYQLVRHPVLARTEPQGASDALKFALAQWTVLDWHLIWPYERRTWIGENLRYTRVRAIERYVLIVLLVVFKAL
jgi:hypothetical protein